MAKILTYDDIINRIAGGFSSVQPIYDTQLTNIVAFGGNSANYARAGYTKDMPSTSLPTAEGVSAYMLTGCSIFDTDTNSSTALIICKLTNLGSLNIATPTFTDGSAMPTVTELNVSRVSSGPVFMEVTTALSANPGSITITYTDQDGNSTETTTAQSLGASAPLHSGGFINLNTGDSGVRDITAATRTGGSSPTGVVKFWGVTPITLLGKSSIRSGGGFDNLVTADFNPIRLLASDQLGVIMMVGGTGARGTMGMLTFVGDS